MNFSNFLFLHIYNCYTNWLCVVISAIYLMIKTKTRKTSHQNVVLTRRLETGTWPLIKCTSLYLLSSSSPSSSAQIMNGRQSINRPTNEKTKHNKTTKTWFAIGWVKYVMCMENAVYIGVRVLINASICKSLQNVSCDDVKRTLSVFLWFLNSCFFLLVLY